MKSTLILTCEADLRSALPNQVPIAKGETSLFDKISSYIISAESWIFSTFIPVPVAMPLITNPDDTFIDDLRPIAACEALRRALPTLDLVLTPNGFATLGTQNLAVASKSRVDRLVAQLIAERDEAIIRLIPLLIYHVEGWRDTLQGKFFLSTLAPTPQFAEMCGITENKWEWWLAHRAAIIDIEEMLAETYFSPELIARMRRHEDDGFKGLPELEHVRDGIHAQIALYLQEKPINHRRMKDLVNYIREHPAAFPEWHNSLTARLYFPEVFVNKKKASGYWF